MKLATLLQTTAAPPVKHLGLALLGMLGLWAASSYGYYYLVSAMSLNNGYDEAPFFFAAYYLLWTVASVLAFRGVLQERLSHAFTAYNAFALAGLLLALGSYVTLVLPSLPEVTAEVAPPNPPDFMFASAWYYLPKSTDILFQQVMVASLILTAAKQGFAFGSITLAAALVFGGYHLTLYLDGFTALYVARFTAAACLFGLVVPYIYLRLKNGFLLAYGLHWSFYALDATLTHFILSVP